MAATSGSAIGAATIDVPSLRTSADKKVGYQSAVGRSGVGTGPPESLPTPVRRNIPLTYYTTCTI